MTSIFLAVYGLYLILVGVTGNGPALFSQLQTERQFLYWIIVMMVIAGLWETKVGEPFAKSFAVLIVLGFLLHNNNYKTLGANLTLLLAKGASGIATTNAASAASTGAAAGAAAALAQ